jgi:hypothetical protein
MRGALAVVVVIVYFVLLMLLISHDEPTLPPTDGRTVPSLIPRPSPESANEDDAIFVYWNSLMDTDLS